MTQCPFRIQDRDCLNSLWACQSQVHDGDHAAPPNARTAGDWFIPAAPPGAPPA